jgi:hypothetical protein
MVLPIQNLLKTLEMCNRSAFNDSAAMNYSNHKYFFNQDTIWQQHRLLVSWADGDSKWQAWGCLDGRWRSSLYAVHKVIAMYLQYWTDKNEFNSSGERDYIVMLIQHGCLNVIMQNLY